MHHDLWQMWRLWWMAALRSRPCTSNREPDAFCASSHIIHGTRFWWAAHSGMPKKAHHCTTGKQIRWRKQDIRGWMLGYWRRPKWRHCVEWEKRETCELLREQESNPQRAHINYVKQYNQIEGQNTERVTNKNGMDNIQGERGNAYLICLYIQLAQQ